MTAGNGFPAGMDRFALDAGTAERLVRGAVDVADAPPQYRDVAAVLLALREPAESWDLVDGPAVAQRIVATVTVKRTNCAVPRSRRFASRTRVAVASLVASGLALTGGLAAAGALPTPAQRVASAVLEKAGITVPSGDEETSHRGTAPTNAHPTPPTASSVESNAVSPGATAPAPHDAGATAPVGASQDGARTEPPAGKEPTPNATPPGNGNGNAYGEAKAVGANGNGHPNTNGNPNGNGNGNAYGRTKANVTGSTDPPGDPSVAPAIPSP